MNDLKFTKEVTLSGYSKNSFVYSFLTSLKKKLILLLKKELIKKLTSNNS